MFKCEKCNKEFKTKQDLNRHQLKKIPCDRILKCVKCNKDFKTKYNLNRHLTSCGTLDKDFISKIITDIELLKSEVKLLKSKIVIQDSITINTFGNEDTRFITKELLEDEILKIINKDTGTIPFEYMGKILKCNTNDIKLLDLHILLTKLIYFNKDENRTLKKEFKKYYIKDDEWKEIDFEDLHFKVLNKQQDILINLKSSEMINDYKLIKILENYFEFDDDDNLQIQKSKINLPKRKYKLLNELFDYELDYMCNA